MLTLNVVGVYSAYCLVPLMTRHSTPNEPRNIWKFTGGQTHSTLPLSHQISLSSPSIRPETRPDLQMAFIELYDSAKDSASSSVPSPESYQPSLSDAVAVKALLQRRTCFPLELVDAIMDEAAYWAPYPCRGGHS